MRKGFFQFVPKMWILNFVIWLPHLAYITCRTQRQFYPQHGMYYPVTPLYSYTKVPLTVEQCERMCRQVLKCTGFTMRWTNHHHGYCDFFEFTVTVMPVNGDGKTLYLEGNHLCPASMLCLHLKLVMTVEKCLCEVPMITSFIEVQCRENIKNEYK